MAQDPGAGPNAHHEAARIIAAELAMQEASSRLNALAAEQPAGLADSVRHELAVAAAQYSFRQAARQEQLRVYELASYSAVETAVIPLIPAGVQAPIENLIAALHSLYILAGIDEYYLVNVHFNHPYTDAEPLSALRAYYNEASRRYGIDPSYLASINFIESNFGRVKDTSSAGAYLVRNGAPYNMRNAIFQYNHDFDYVDSVESFARAYRADPGWLDRMYYWNTFG